MDKRQIRFFNTTGPCNPKDHYMLPPEERLVGAQLHRYIRDKLYWVLHAPRQTGKTTFLQNWAREINAAPEAGAVACYVTVERCQGIPDAERVMPNICHAIRQWAEWTGLPVPEAGLADPGSMLNGILQNWAALVAPQALIVLFDEVDVLQGDALISFLRQLRGGFAGRGAGTFPTSIALVGMRDLKDYITAAKGGVPVNPGSPFNVKTDSAVLSNFTRDDIARLFAQRTAETGQEISVEALDYVYEQSRGQPWIVNSLFMRATMRVLDETSSETVTTRHIREAREQMILARETHLDALAYRLEDPRIRAVMETLMTGEPDLRLAESEAFRLCLDLGLVAIERGTPVVANPIYRETLARQMTYGPQLAMPEPEWKWAKPDGTLDMDALLREFQKFWRLNSETWEEMSDYTEVFPHLLLQAFLQRVTNGEGRIEREYAAGRGRMDLAVEFKGAWNIIEIKLARKNRSPAAAREEGLVQIRRYRDLIDPAAPCYLVIFDRRSGEADWEERLFWTREGDVTVIGC
ncbi:MAG: PD-(D/E)XK nuclease domain-containing protein [Treponema sp.]|jgi:hypothetical protein|nr:PD-(D/E)XK nuclease domain-containing protein [Treponema sp.]